MNKKLFVITGPTASGKTSLSIQLAKEIDAQIICADSRIVYKDLDIVSAKPTLREQDGIKHHLIDIITPFEDFSAGDFVSRAKDIINNAFENNKNIIICGGTWFYIKSLLDKKALPNCKIDHQLREELSKLDNFVLWEKLNSLDKKRASQIHINNKDKIIRSIEMCVELNQPISEYQRPDNEIFEAKWFMIKQSREELYARINKRVDIMLEMGLYEEWNKNKEKYKGAKVLDNTIGYKEFFDLEKGIYKTKQDAIAKIKQYTRNFAKRQLTYFNANKDIRLINSFDDLIKEVKNV